MASVAGSVLLALRKVDEEAALSSAEAAVLEVAAGADGDEAEGPGVGGDRGGSGSGDGRKGREEGGSEMHFG